jgi:hypothetical protein
MDLTHPEVIHMSANALLVEPSPRGPKVRIWEVAQPLGKGHFGQFVTHHPAASTPNLISPP